MMQALHNPPSRSGAGQTASGLDSSVWEARESDGGWKRKRGEERRENQRREEEWGGEERREKLRKGRWRG